MTSAVALFALHCLSAGLPLAGTVIVGAPPAQPQPHPDPPESNVPEEPQRLDELLPPLLPRAFGLARRLCGNDADAEDLVQDAALRATKGFGTFAPGTNFRAWFFKIMYNAYYTSGHARRHEASHVDLADVPDLFLHGQVLAHRLHEVEADPARALLARLDTEEIASALGSLPQEFRLVCTLFYVDDLSYATASTVLGIPVGTVRSRLHRGRKLLQKKLWETAVANGIVRDLNSGVADVAS